MHNTMDNLPALAQQLDKHACQVHVIPESRTQWHPTNIKADTQKTFLRTRKHDQKNDEPKPRLNDDRMLHDGYDILTDMYTHLTSFYTPCV